MGEYLTIQNGIILYFSLAIPIALVIVMRRAGRQRRILRDGVQVPARVAGLRDTGARYNDAVVAELTLDIERPEPGQQPRQVVTEFTVPQLFTTRFQPGCEVVVRVDPTDSSRVVVDRKAMGI
ncbi:hypothetical protein SAMN02745121_05444 [Nannocystis exedens]|uniref:DUF3592 domain-containing protein n=1 Tax=Nannocystis exedens TaxID=54 RepID=A0A1I2D950_9BACT|nr:hypothetical protein [Nannocystis exedens]PCC70671.1 hypothetical protein NAEX_03735 [Nannocystis exedens]SFE76643.1 hypothetical protein SAMN02745121_05444 [Nannocystis exedens]